jgi:hypothetical protein
LQTAAVNKRKWKECIRNYKDGCLLGCSAMLSGRSLPPFQRSLLPPTTGSQPDYTVLQPRRQPSSYSRLWEPQIVLEIV